MVGKTSKSECERSSLSLVSSSWTPLLCLVSFRSETHIHTQCEDHKCVLAFFGLHLSSVHYDDSCSYTVSGYTTFQSISTPQFFQQSTTLHSLLFYVSMWNELCNFFFSHLLIFLTCGFILLSVALFVQWHIKKKENMFFFLCKGTKRLFFFQCVKARV